jgi:hypothetical protein
MGRYSASAGPAIAGFFPSHQARQSRRADPTSKHPRQHEVCGLLQNRRGCLLQFNIAESTRWREVRQRIEPEPRRLRGISTRS